MSRIQCLACFYYIEDRKCVAFPIGIPTEIYTTTLEHNEPYPNDQGVRFKWRDEVETEPLQKLKQLQIIDGVIEHYIAINQHTGEIESTLVLELPDKLRKKQRRKKKL